MKTNLKLTLLAAAFLFVQPAHAVFFMWQKSYNGGNTDAGLHVTLDALSNSYLTGVSTLPGGDKIVSSAYTVDGTLLWQVTGNTFLPGTVRQIERDDALNTFVLCQTGPSAFTLIRYNVNAVEKWRRNYTDVVVKFKAGKPAAIYVCSLTPAGVTIERLNKNTGSVNWTRSYPDATLLSNDQLADFTIDEDGTSYFAGTSNNGGSADDYKLIKLTKNGAVVYNIQYDSGSGDEDETYRICPGTAGELFLVGDYHNNVPGRTFYNLVKFNAAGVHQWHTPFEESVANIYTPLELMVGPDGHVVVSGTDHDFYNINPAGETRRIEVNKFNSVTGAELFGVYPADPDLTNPDILEEARCMTIAADNSIYIGGTSNVYAGIGTDPNRWLAVKVNGSTGDREWVEAGVQFDPANAINDVAVNAANESYWAGTESDGTGADMILVKYCETGCLGFRAAAPAEGLPGLMIYPNPTSSFFRLENFSSLKISIDIYDLSGRLIKNIKSDQQEIIFGNELISGSYFVDVSAGSGRKIIFLVKTD